MNWRPISLLQMFPASSGGWGGGAETSGKKQNNISDAMEANKSCTHTYSTYVHQ